MDWPIDRMASSAQLTRARHSGDRFGFSFKAPGGCSGTGKYGFISSSAAETASKAKSKSPAARTPRCRSWPPCLMAEGKTTLNGVPRLSDIDSMIKLLGELGCHVYRHEADRPASATARPSTARSISKVTDEKQLRGPLRHRQDDARQHLRARAAAGQARQGDRLDPRRVRHRRPPGRSARPRPAEARRRVPHRKRQHRRRSPQGRLKGCRMYLGGRRGRPCWARSTSCAPRRWPKARRSSSARPASRKSSTAPNCSTRWARRSTATARPRSASKASTSSIGCEHRVIPDRIECGTFMIAAAITNGELELKHCNLDHLIAVVDRLEEVGVKIERAERHDLRHRPRAG